MAKAQCTPDTSIKTTGTFPAVLAEATVGTPYAQDIQYFITKDTTVYVAQLGQTVSAKIDTLRITGVKGMPEGFTYSCHNADCKIVGGTVGCATLKGTPKPGSAGIYPLVVMINIRATAFLGPLPVGQTVNDSNSRYAIIVNGASGQNELVAANDLMIYPNPAKETLQFYLPGKMENAKVSILNVKGERVFEQTYSLNYTKEEINLSELANGLYFIEIADGTSSYKKKFVKE